MPRFSVIVPVRDDPDHYQEAIASVLRQTFADFELIVVDDGSEPPIVVPDDDRITLIRRPVAGGPAAARNSGLAHARSEFVAFLDSDDLFLPQRLEAVARPPAGAQVVVAGRSASQSFAPIEIAALLRTTTPHLGEVTIRRKLLDELGGFDESYLACEDVELWIRLARRNPAAVGLSSYQWVWRPDDRPRPLHGRSARERFSRQLLVDHADFYRADRRARGFRWRRVQIYQRSRGDLRGAWTSLGRSARSWPSPRLAIDVARLVRQMIDRGKP